MSVPRVPKDKDRFKKTLTIESQCTQTFVFETDEDVWFSGFNCRVVSSGYGGSISVNLGSLDPGLFSLSVVRFTMGVYSMVMGGPVALLGVLSFDGMEVKERVKIQIEIENLRAKKVTLELDPKFITQDSAIAGMGLEPGRGGSW